MVPDRSDTSFDPDDDAVHIAHPLVAGMTYCGQSIFRKMNVARWDEGDRPDAAGGCWTCLKEVQNGRS